MKVYKVFIRYHDRLAVNIIKTDDIYHEIGKIYCQSMESIKRIDYKELKSLDSCPIYEPCCEVCLQQCGKYLAQARKEECI